MCDAQGPMLAFAASLLANLDAVLVCTRSGELPKVLGDLSSLTVLDVSHNQLTRALIAPIHATIDAFCLIISLFTGLPKELLRLVNLKTCDVSRNSLLGELSIIHTERFGLREVDVVFAQVLCQRCFQLRLRFSICRVAIVWLALLTSSLVEFRLNGAL